MMAQTTVTVPLNECFPKDNEFRILVADEYLFTTRYDHAERGFRFHGPIIVKPAIEQSIKFNVIDYVISAGHSGPLIVPKMEFEPQLGDIITFGTSRVWYTIISLDTIEPHIVMLDRPLEESLRANRAGVVVEPVILQTRFRPAKHGHFINQGMVCGVSILDEKLACVMLA